MIIQTLLDTDLYKLTMMQGVFHQFPQTQVEYGFTCRTPGIDFRPAMNDIQNEIKHLCSLDLTDEEGSYLETLGYMKSDFIRFLESFRLTMDHVSMGEKNGEFFLNIKGPWLHTILFEVPVLSIINECYYRINQPHPNWDAGRDKLVSKINLIKNTGDEPLDFTFSDFGTRRRFARAWHEELLTELHRECPEQMVGTSNVDLARRLGLTPVGTMAHEWLMASQALCPTLADSQTFALKHWIREYPRDLGIALSDVAGFDAFLHDFNIDLATAYDGCRHDSGDPFSWGDRLIDHYHSLGIDPKTKRAIFSDGLSVQKAIDIARYFKGRINTSFGIGTSLTNDVSGQPIQIVIKMTYCQGSPVAKLSDSPGKQMCRDQEYLDRLTHIFKGEQRWMSRL